MAHQMLIDAWIKIHPEFVGHQLLLIDLIPNHLDLFEAQLVVRDFLLGPPWNRREVDQRHLHQELVVDNCSAMLQSRKKRDQYNYGGRRALTGRLYCVTTRTFIE